MAIVERVKFGVEWLRRLGKSSGFGIQSPVAYQFVTEVLCQPMPYYAYDDLDVRFPDVKGRQKKVFQLLFRLSNYCQASKTFVTPMLSEVGREYLLAGNQRSEMLREADGCGLAVVSTADGMDFGHLSDVLPDDAVLVVLDIYRNGRESAFWQEIKACGRIGTTFDAYDVGVAIFGRQIHRKHYAVNL